MAIFTSEELIEQISAWKGALLAVSASQSYTISNRTLTKADLPEIRNTLIFLEKRLTNLHRKGFQLNYQQS